MTGRRERRFRQLPDDLKEETKKELQIAVCGELFIERAVDLS